MEGHKSCNSTKNKAKSLWKKVNPWKKDKKKAKPSIEEEHHHHHEDEDEEDEEEEDGEEELELSSKEVPECVVNFPNCPLPPQYCPRPPCCPGGMPTFSCYPPYLPSAYRPAGRASSLGHAQYPMLPPPCPFPPADRSMAANPSGYPPLRPCEEQEGNIYRAAASYFSDDNTNGCNIS